MVAKHAAEFRDCPVGKSRVSQDDTETMTDIVKVRTALQCLAVCLDGFSKLSDIAVGVTQLRLKVRELAARGGVERAIGRPGAPTWPWPWARNSLTAHPPRR